MMEKIRKAGVLDANKIAEMESRYIEVAWSERQIAESMNSGLYDFYVAEIDGEIVAYAFVQWCLDEGNVCNVATNESFRNKGIATRILNIMQNDAVEKGVKTLLLEVNEDNASAISLYEKLGFVRVYTRANYYGDKSAIVMQKSI